MARLVGSGSGDDGVMVRMMILRVAQGDDVDGGSMVRMEVVAVVMVLMVAAAAAGGGKRRVEESGCGDRIDPVMRSVFGVGRKSPPEKFSGGGWPKKVAAGRREGWPDFWGRWRRERVYLCVCV
ncbi:hypothetical protein Tco_0286909 [Tanacetum coccineum]